MVKTYVINIIGAPGVGKTTISALLFARLKLRGYICEYVQEYAKKLVWMKDYDSLNNQYHVTKKQYELLQQIAGHVNFIVTDGPLIHGIYYNKYNKDNISNIDKTEKYILDSFNKFNNINIVLDRVNRLNRKYETEGRIQTEDEAKDIDIILKHLLKINSIKYVNYPAEESSLNDIIEFIVKFVDKNDNDNNSNNYKTNGSTY
jgi:broad-specificity NMP kinase